MRAEQAPSQVVRAKRMSRNHQWGVWLCGLADGAGSSLPADWTSILKHSGAARKCHYSASQRKTDLDISVFRWMKSLCQMLGGLLTRIFLIKTFFLPRHGTAKTSESPGRGRFQTNLSLRGWFHGSVGRIILSVEDFHPGFQEKVTAALDPLHSGFRYFSGVSWCSCSQFYLGKVPWPQW